MTRPICTFTLMFLACMVIAATSMPAVTAFGSGKSQSLSPEATSYEIDVFTYRTSLRLPDGTEGLLMRSALTVTFLYEHHQPSINELYMSMYIGFYYGKTILGRAVVQNIKIGSIAFYPKWHDSGGYAHDLYMITPLFMLNGSVYDGQFTGGTFLIDGDADSRYVTEFGGTLIIDELAFVLGDGLEIPLTNGSMEIVLEKYYNDFGPKAASLRATENFTHTSDAGMLMVMANGAAIIPFIVIVDGFIIFSLIGIASLLLVLVALHVTGHRKLSFRRVGALFLHRPVLKTRQLRHRQ